MKLGKLSEEKKEEIYNLVLMAIEGYDINDQTDISTQIIVAVLLEDYQSFFDVATEGLFDITEKIHSSGYVRRDQVNSFINSLSHEDKEMSDLEIEMLHKFYDGEDVSKLIDKKFMILLERKLYETV